MKDRVMNRAEALCEAAPRMWENEAEAADLVERFLRETGVDTSSETYPVVYPTYPDYGLSADNTQIDCLPSGLSQGTIENKRVIDNWHISGRDFKQPNINFNPYCSGISKPTFYNAPALTVSRSDIPRLMDADSIEGYLEIERKEFMSRNIVVGNTCNPDHMFFTHYDSWWGGFTDNAFAVALLIEIAGAAELDDICIVFAGSEEFSNEEDYWCYGYRQFEKRHREAMDSASLTVVDTLGIGQPIETNKFMEDAFLLDSKDLMDKASLVTTRPENWRHLYHSPLDTRHNVTDAAAAAKFLKNVFRSKGVLQ